MLLKFSWRHFLRHWRMNLVLLAGLVLTAAFLAGLPMYAVAISGRNLAQRLADAPVAAKNIQVRGSALTASQYGALREGLGPLLADRITVQNAQMTFGRFIHRDGTNLPFAESLQLQLWAFSDLGSHVTVVDGRLPDIVPPADPNQRFTEGEIAIGLDAWERLNLSGMNLRLGDELRLDDQTLRLRIVGIVQPADPESEVWWGDLSPFTFLRPPNFSNQPDTVTLSALLPPTSMESYFPSHTTIWRILTNPAVINVNNAAAVKTALTQSETRLRNIGATMETSLIDILTSYETDLNSARVTLFLLSIQALLFVLYTLTMLSSFLLAQSRSELASLAGRGFTSLQITLIYALSGLLLALLAAPLGPLAAQGALRVWSLLSGATAPAAIPLTSWQLALAAVGFGWLTIVGAIFLNARGNILDWQRQLARPPRLAGWQRTYVDFFLLALGGLIYWQLADTGSFLTTAIGDPAANAAGTADPFLLIGPSLLLIGVALVFLRLFPLLLRLAAWLTRRAQGLILPFGLARLSRDPVGPSRAVLLISLAAGLTLFAVTFENSLSQRQQEMARYRIGADLRVQAPNGAGADAYGEIGGLDGAAAWTPVYVNRSRWGPQLGREAQLIAVDPATFSDVAEYAPGITTLRVADVLAALQPGPTGAIPAVFSIAAYPLDKQIGDQVTYVVGQYRVDFEVRGLVQNFPAAEGAFFVTNLALVEEAVELARLTSPWDGSKEVWLRTQPAQHDALAAEVNGRLGIDPFVQIRGDAQQRRRFLQSNMVALQTLGAFNLNATTLVILSVAIFLMMHFFAARQRLYEFSLLRSMGLTTRQLFALLSVEGGMVMLLGLLAGSGLGLGLAAVMRPFLGRTLRVAMDGDTIRRLVIDLPQTSGLYLLLIAFYSLALGLLLLALLRAGIHRTLRVGEE